MLFCLWAGGGNVGPQLTIARRLGQRGHTVRMLAPAVLRERIERAGVVYEPYRRTPEHDEGVPERSLVRDFEATSPVAAAIAARRNLLTDTLDPVAADTLAILERHPIDVVAFDFTLFGAQIAAEKKHVAAAMLVHTVYPFPVPGRPAFGTGWSPMGGPLGRARNALGAFMFGRVYERPLLPHLNRVRAELGLPPVESFAALLGRADRILVLTSRAFDFPGALPSNAEYVGAQRDEPDWTPPWQSPWPSDDPRPLVVVGLTTTYQAHGDLLKRIVSALGTLPVRALVTTGSIRIDAAPPNVHLAQFVPHERVLPHARVVVTHAGLGTVHAALAHGVPLVCLPIGRDQPDNAARVVWHGAGVRLSSKSASETIADAVKAVLEDDTMPRAARQLAAKFAADDAASAGPAAIERLASRTRRASSREGVPAVAGRPLA
jgi:MGT family glycosyltransferase